jgi:hypothetical protein
MLPKIEVQPRYLLGSSSWQRRQLQKLSAKELKERNMAWVPKGSVQVQKKDGIQVKGAMEVIEKRKTKRQSPTPRFAPNHQNYQSSYHHILYKCYLCFNLGVHL